MCGIAGLAGLIDPHEAKRAVRKMTLTLARRGPDGEGMACWHNAVFGHRRLAIIDLSAAGHQPMVSADRAVGVVFNGEIYNYRDLRHELSTRGCRFSSNTDTEVLIHGYRAWGLDQLVSKLRGMFAFALWDDQQRKLCLVRDRLGVKPLVFALCGRAIAFASTVRALRVAGFVSRLNEDAVLDFLELGYITESHAIYDGAFKVPAATIVEWSDGALSQRQYWAPPPVSPAPTLPFQEALEKTEQLFLEAVKIRLHADVPVGVLLSGGIDSALVCWAVMQHGQDLTAYTIGVPGDPWDETIAARATAHRLGIHHRVLEMSGWETSDLEELTSAYAEPFACASALGMLRVSREVTSSAKVLLTGDGGDDVFLGYPRHRHLWLAGKLSRVLPGPLKQRWRTARAMFPRLGPLRRAAAFLDYTTGDLRAFTTPVDGLVRYKTNGMLGDRLVSPSLHSQRLAWFSDAGEPMLANFLEYERQTQFVSEYLTKVDGSTMHYGVEARSPFLDQFLWEFAASLPFDVRLHNGQLKAILRALARRRVGGSVARGRKRGFGVPVQRWLLSRWRPQVEATLYASLLEKDNWLRAGSTRTLLRLAAHEAWAAHQLWSLFVLESWMRHDQHITA